MRWFGEELSAELNERKEKLETLQNVAGNNQVLEYSDPEAVISILKDNMAAQTTQTLAWKAPVFSVGTADREKFFYELQVCRDFNRS